MDFMWSLPDFNFWRTPLDYSKPILQVIIKRNLILKIAISKKIVINLVKDELNIILVGRLQNQRVTVNLSLFCSITIAFKFSNRITNISNYFHFPMKSHFLHVQARSTHILESKLRRTACPFTSLSWFPNEIQ